MKSNNRALASSLFLTPSPPLYLRPFTTYLTLSAITSEARINKVLTRPCPELQNRRTHPRPLRGPAIVNEFLPSRPLRDFRVHNLDEKDRAYGRYRAAGEITGKRNVPAPCIFEAYVTELFGHWLDTR